MVTKKQAIKAVKQGKTIFAWVSLTEGDGVYIQVSKKVALDAIKHATSDDDVIFNEDNTFNVVLRECGDTYLN